jgi:hypothetical protein
MASKGNRQFLPKPGKTVLARPVEHVQHFKNYPVISVI